MIDALVGILLGGIITLAVSWVFYVRAARGLEREADKLRGMVNALALHLQKAGVIKAEWSEDGNLKHYKVVALKGVAEGESGATGPLTVEQGLSPTEQDDG